ncbi:MAG: hypothetical protein IJ874_05815 [Ruminococcus sp.]|nr:hypothetical protein [Ruminococcus sp.]
MKFRDDEHIKLYNKLCSRMRYLDCYHRCVAYLIALDSVCRQHVEDIFDFQEDGIKRNSLNRGWQTGTSKRTTRLAFNLWNSCCTDGETYTDKDGYEDELPSSYYSPDYIFCCEYAVYYWEAIKLRYPEYTNE